jgi:serine protease Do
MKPTFKPTAVAAALAAAGVLATGSAGAFDLPWSKKNEPSQAVAGNAQKAPDDLAMPKATGPAAVAPAAAPNYRAIVQQYGPAVVGVTVEGMQTAQGPRGGQGLPPGLENDPFFQFFRGLPGFEWRGMPPSERPFRGQGSGFIISSDGMILTNAHVVREAKEVTVKLSDRREFSAKVLGSDPATDVAVLKIDAKGLPTVRLGNPEQLQVGDPVLAIGSPFGFEQTATQGIVSAKGRSLPGDAYVPFIQTDAAVNPGNSGGPLFDGAGNVVGINAQIYSQSGGYQGLAFAIPINVALKVKDQIVATGKATHARLGVVVQDLNQSLAESFGLKRPDGALVASVAPDSPAAKVGLKSGDVITSVNGERIERSGDLSSRIGLSSPGDKVKLQVWRDKGQREMEVQLAAVEDATTQAAAGGPAEQGRLGLALRPLAPEEKAALKADHGLVVQGSTGAAARAGIVPGDVVMAINGKPVSSIDEIRGVLQSKPKNVALLVVRNGERIFVPVNLG